MGAAVVWGLASGVCRLIIRVFRRVRSRILRRARGLVRRSRISIFWNDHVFARKVARLAEAPAPPPPSGGRASKPSPLERPDVVVAHDVFGLQAAFAVARRVGAPVVWDAVEIPLIGQRTGAAWQAPPPVRMALDWKYRKWTRSVESTLAISESMAAWLRTSYGMESVVPVYNAHERTARPASDEQLRALGIDPRRKLVIAPNTILPGYGVGTAIRSLSHLPESYSLLTIGQLGGGNLEYRDRLLGIARDSGVLDRVQMIEQLPQSEFLGVLARAHAGLLLLPRVDRLNLRMSLPNRFFDLVAAGAPIISAPVGDAPAWVRRFELGFVDSFDDEQRLAEVVLACEHVSGSRGSEALSWPHYERRLLDELNRLEAERMLIVARKRLENNARMARFARSAMRSDISVGVMATSVPPPESEHHVEGVEYRPIP